MIRTIHWTYDYVYKICFGCKKNPLNINTPGNRCIYDCELPFHGHNILCTDCILKYHYICHKHNYPIPIVDGFSITIKHYENKLFWFVKV